MQPASYFIQPVKTYFIAFLVIGLLLLILLVGKLYNQAQTVQTTLLEKTRQQAQEEINEKLESTIIELATHMLEVAEWDEVRQQIDDPTYYYFWHDDRLKGSKFFQSNHMQIEIYDHTKWPLMPPVTETNTESKTNLPLFIENTDTTVIFSEKGQPYLHLFEPVFARDSQTLLGYIGMSVNLLPYFLTNNRFQYVDQDSIYFTGSGEIELSELPSHIHFSPIKNEVSEALWQLINDFIFQVMILLIVSIIVITITFQILFTHPMQRLSSYLQQIKKKPKDPHSEPSETFFLKEFEELKHSLHDYHRDLQSTQQALNTQYKIVWEQARRDALTNIHNRRAFDETWNELVASYAYNPVSISFILFDCDFFKALNDTYGHEVGDDVIRISAKTIQNTLPEEFPVFRIGGDEFAVIIKKHPLHESFNVAKTCLKALKSYNFSGIGIKEKLSFSVGISHLEPHLSKNLRNDLLNLPRQADIAMYKAKQSLQNKIQCYKSELDNESLSLVSNKIINTIVDAIHTGKNINMHFQAIQSVIDGSIYYESLVRIQNEEELIYPKDIFLVVERRRLETEIDTQIIQKILSAFTNKIIPPNTGVSINVSSKTLLQPNFIELFQPFAPYLNDYKIVIEIVENTLIDHMEYAQTILNHLRQQGFLIALDDFGSGYSSIRYLAHMPVDIIKFDMSMTQALAADQKTRNIICSTAKMVRDSGYDLVLEGVETHEMLKKAKQAGATHIQGYLLSKPQAIPSTVSNIVPSVISTI